MKERFLSSLLIVISLTSLSAQNNSKGAPKLVVGITVDQLRTDYIEAFSSLYGEKGFKRLLKEGRLYSNVEFDFKNVDKSSATAAIFTGTTPSLNGILGDSWFDRKTLTLTSSVDDKNYMGIYTSEATSAEKLKVSNITDELMAATSGKSLTYSISPFREMSVMMGGHASNGAFWINDETGKWSGSTYYTDFPKWVSDYNDNQGLDLRIGNIEWAPSLPVTMYDNITSGNNQITFKYDFDDEKKNKYRRLKTSPFANEEVNKLVNRCLNSTMIGSDNIPDFLSLGYYAGNYDHKSVAEASMEIQDTYVRLDKSIGELIDMIDSKVGFNNTLIFITSTGYSDSEPADNIKFRIPTGEFNIKRCSALLNIYLGAIYGQGKYVEADHDQEIYLNNKLIEQKKLDKDDLMRKASEFLVEFSGVKNVYSSKDIYLGAWNPELNIIRNSFYIGTSADFWLEILPGWSIAREHSLDYKVVRDIYTSSPLFFFGWNVNPAIINTPVKVEKISSTISHSMRIRAPNASNSSPLIDLRKE